MGRTLCAVDPHQWHADVTPHRRPQDVHALGIDRNRHAFESRFAERCLEWVERRHLLPTWRHQDRPSVEENARPRNPVGVTWPSCYFREADYFFRYLISAAIASTRTMISRIQSNPIPPIIPPNPLFIIFLSSPQLSDCHPSPRTESAASRNRRSLRSLPERQAAAQSSIVRLPPGVRARRRSACRRESAQVGIAIARDLAEFRGA